MIESLKRMRGAMGRSKSPDSQPAKQQLAEIEVGRGMHVTKTLGVNEERK